MTKEKLKEIISRHAEWLRAEDDGVRANLRGANLAGINFAGANLSGAALGNADLSNADLSNVDLTSAVLTGAKLIEADLASAILLNANLSGADLTGANLCDAVGGNLRIQSLQIHPYRIIVLDKDTAWGGCTKKSVADWLAYDGEGLEVSDKTYLETVTKPFLRMVIAHG